MPFPEDCVGRPDSLVRPRFMGLLLFANAFERLFISFLVHEPSGFSIPFCPPLIVRVESLGAVFDCSDAPAIASGRILRHVVIPFLLVSLVQ
jgi:hypothetical protein